MALQLQPLKPWAALRLFRPLRFRRLAAASRDATRACKATDLLRQHFSNQLSRLNGPLRLEEWPVIMTVFLEAVETAGWFEVNWLVLNEAHQFMLSDNSDNGERLALFLTYIPVKMLGLTNELIFEMPPMELLRALLHSEVEVITSSLQIETELYDSLEAWRANEENRRQAWGRLRRIETNPSDYPEPLRFLPELARWACRNTGNPLLDQHFDPRHNGPWFRWDTELPVIRSAWRRASPVREAYLRLMDWYSRRGDNLVKLTNYIIGVTDDANELNW